MSTIGARFWSSTSSSTPGAGAAAVSAEGDFILRPLLDFLDAKLSLFACTCEKPILKRILKVCILL